MPPLQEMSPFRAYFSWLCPKKEYELDTNLNGGERPFVVTGSLRTVSADGHLPDVLTSSRQCLAGDIDKMGEPSASTRPPERISRCASSSIPSKIEIQQIIRDGINLYRSRRHSMGLRVKIVDNLEAHLLRRGKLSFLVSTVRCVRGVRSSSCRHTTTQRGATSATATT